MKLVLLPGADGTGLLFNSLLEAMGNNVDVCVIDYPQKGSQDYKTLTEHVIAKLPKEPFILLAESLAGPIAVNIAATLNEHLKGIIFAAAFLTAPQDNMITMAKKLPLKLLDKFPVARTGYKMLFLGNEASEEVVSCFQKAINKVPEKTLKQRLASIQSLELKQVKSDVPAFYIQATKDMLVSKIKLNGFREIFSNLEVERVEGPHYILLSQPEICADLIHKKLQEWSS